MGTGTLERGTLGVVVGKKKKPEERPGSGKESINFRLSAEGKRMADELATLLGVSRSDVFEMSVRAYFRLHLTLPSKDDKK